WELVCLPFRSAGALTSRVENSRRDKASFDLDIRALKHHTGSAYRVGPDRKLHDLSGTGGLRSPGRWHHAGQPVVYLAESPAGALLEVRVHTSANDIPPDFTLLKIGAPEVQIQAIRLGERSAEWQSGLE